MKTVQRQDGAHGDGIWAVAWTNTTNTVVTASVDNTVKTWQGDNLEPVRMSDRQQGQPACLPASLCVRDRHAETRTDRETGRQAHAAIHTRRAVR
jgi:WD40 repeat protein